MKFSEILWLVVEIAHEDWIKLPEKFVLKANHGAHIVNVIIKSELNFVYVRSVCTEWM